MPADKMTHVLYGFIPVCGPNVSLQQANPSGYSALQQQCAGKPDYTVVVHDRFAALEKSYPGDKWDDPIKGNFGQLIKMKQSYPDIKVLPSIGGWTLSDPFFYLASDSAKRATFVASVKAFLQTYTFFDGVDIDWEYPGGGGANPALGSSSDREGYVLVMRDLRNMLDELEAETGRTYELTSAVGAAPAKIDSVNYAEAQQYMDYVFAMTYDFYGTWSTELGHHAALYDSVYQKHSGFSGYETLSNLMTAGVPASKLVLGAAFYGRGWGDVQGGGMAGVGSISNSYPYGVSRVQGTWEAGVLDYADIEANYMGGPNGQGINGFTYYYDETAEAPYLWNANTRELITFDDARSVEAKARYVSDNGFAGVFSWEIDADSGTLINAIHRGFQQ
ncbi:MAG: glycosyl hydrolase family 18 protein [Chromatiales bacterium]|nr:glycosyl hydrolase family 18 protein [Chromatiales bacterium]